MGELDEMLNMHTMVVNNTAWESTQHPCNWYVNRFVSVVLTQTLTSESFVLQNDDIESDFTCCFCLRFGNVRRKTHRIRVI